MTSARRIGAPDAKNRVVLLDAAEQLLLEEGYASVTSRRVAEKAGLKPQLVHYYFRTMEDLFLAVFRRMAEAGLSVLTTALAVAAAAVGAVEVQHAARGHPADDGIHGPGESPQGAARRDRLLRRTFPRRAEQGDRRGAGALRRRVQRCAACGVDRLRHQRFAGPGDGTRAGDDHRSRRDVRVLRAMDCAAGGRTASERRPGDAP